MVLSLHRNIASHIHEPTNTLSFVIIIVVDFWFADDESGVFVNWRREREREQQQQQASKEATKNSQAS
jgi:hypothetical protein